MSQWGEARTIDGITMIPRVRTEMWVPAAANDVIESIHLVGRGDLSLAQAKCVQAQTKQQYVTKPYSAWLELPQQPSR